MDEARRAAEAVADEVARWQSRQHIIEILLVYAADAVAQAVKERDALHAHLDKEIDERADQQAEEIAQLREALESRDQEWEAVVAVATRAERERCATFVEERWPVKREDGTWTMVPRPVTKECIPKTMALAEALRRAPTEPTR